MSDTSRLELQNFLQKEFELVLTGEEDFEMMLASRINDLVQKDFPALVNILYKIDVDESKLKLALEKFPDEDAGKIIAKLIIDRQLQKIAARTSFTKNVDAENEETW